jgi:hypothetical protein
MKQRRTIHQRRAYAMRRASQAVDRMIRATSLDEKLRASRWAERWGLLAGVQPPSRRG